MKKDFNNVNITNKKARFSYELLDKYVAGIQLYGTEIKSIRLGKASIAESFCQFQEDELYVVNMSIEQYVFGSTANHKVKRDRKLLLQRKELNKLFKKTNETSFTIIPLKIFINKNGLAKIEIALAKGKKLFDKRHDIKEKDIKRDIERLKKNF